jgi:ABC-type antimicrobial peptide transport system permease subunit
MYRVLDDADDSIFARFLLIRTARPVADVVPAIQSALAPVMGTEPAAVKVDVVDEEFRRLTADRRFSASVMGSLGLLALLMAASGVYVTTASIVAQQRKEIGIRMTLGASSGRIVRAITATTARLLLAGAIVGLAVSWMASSVLESVVFGIRPTDALVYVVPFAIVGAGGLIAAVVPAMRAARVDPLVTLRTE